MKALRGLVWLCVPATVWCAEDIAVNTFLARTGNWFRVTVTVQMPPDWHINANPAAEQGLIPTTVSWKPSAGVRIRSVKYPPGKHYEGRVEIVTEGEAPVGPLRLEGALRYQACYKDTCYPPKTVPLLVTSEDAVPPPPGSAGWLSQGAMTADVTPILPQAPAAAMPLWVMLLGAFVGGMLLNLMPCVLPVISLKILGFVQEGASRRLGLIYGLGVLVSFWLLAAAIIGLKLAGRQVGWGFQFQDVRFVLAMSLLCTTIALSLFGVFEFGLGGRTLEGVMKLATRKGHAGAFFNGMLAVLLATPCTAPFLAPALGFAFTQSCLLYTS
ncbi:MAG: protein-disulfide reductase DsbD family protein, partial [Verrucomicrobiae bacterium]|nr:protein-disulfide reductase DsbD family protein [Verrucomicrobiae bacterium]